MAPDPLASQVAERTGAEPPADQGTRLPSRIGRPPGRAGHPGRVGGCKCADCRERRRVAQLARRHLRVTSSERRQRATDARWRARLARRVDPDGDYECAYCPATFTTLGGRAKHEIAEEARIVNARPHARRP